MIAGRPGLPVTRIENRATTRISRRDFLRCYGATALLAATPGLAHARFFSGSTAFDDYRALVCVFLVGGNDSFNMLVPRGDAEYRAYASSRQTLAVPRRGLLPVSAPGSGRRRFGMHFAMKSLWRHVEAGSAAFLANVGPLVEPTTRDDYFNASVALPPYLFSHDARRLPRHSTELPRSSQPGWPDGVVSLIRDSIAGQRVAAAQAGGMAASVTGKHSRLALSTVFPRSQLGRHLQAVARFIAARDEFAMPRQLFLVAVGGFDSHDRQPDIQPRLLADVSDSLSAFYAATVELGVADRVTTFTQSDFGRTLTSNGSGSDHAWGGNQVVLGGSVLGGRIYGSYPDLYTGSPQDVGGGRFIPSTSADQYAATLARWFGVADAELSILAPNLRNFTVRDLGFLA